MSDQQLIRRIERALGSDERTHEMGVHLRVRGGRLIVEGNVATEERRQNVLSVVHAQEPGLAVSDQLAVTAEPVADQSPGHIVHEQIVHDPNAQH